MTALTSITIIHASRRKELATAAVPVFYPYRRTDIVQDSYRSDHVDTFYDHEFYCHFIKLLFSSFGCTILTLRLIVCGESLRLNSLAEITTIFSTSGRDQPPAEAVLYRNHEPLVQIVSEPWAFVGGEGLYHDSFTYAVLHQDNVATDLYLALEVFGQSHDYNISIYYGARKTR